MKIMNFPSFKDVINARGNYISLQKQLWFQHVFSFQWWFLLILTVVPWIMWWKIVDKNRRAEILIFGIIVAFISANMDMVGRNYMLWNYPINLHWTLSAPSTPFDVTLLPVAYMLCYQFGRSWKSFFIGVVLFSGAFSVGEYLFEAIKIYEEKNWSSLYSFPIYTAIACFAKWIVAMVLKVQKGSTTHA